MTNTQPLVSIIIPVYNREKFIAESIQSILDQTYQNFELIIVDDASTDATVSIINKFKDSRIRLLKHPFNKGVSAALNLGFENAKGEYLGRLDSDDIAHPSRIEKQTNYLKDHSEISIVGSWLNYKDSKKILKFPATHEEIKNLLLLRCPISTGTSLFKREVFDKIKFDETLRFGEDYDYWCKALFLFKAHNLQEVLVYYRYHGNQLSVENKPQQVRDDLKLKLNLFQKIGYDQEIFKDELIFKFLDRKYLDYKEFILIKHWLDFLKKQNGKENIFPQTEFLKMLKHFYNQLNQLFFFHPKYSAPKLTQVKALSKISMIELQQVLFKKIRAWLK